jgi:hypothetical protein
VTEFDPGRFEEKYVHYIEELQAAYRNTFEHLHSQYDSRVLRAHRPAGARRERTVLQERPDPMTHSGRVFPSRA